MQSEKEGRGTRDEGLGDYVGGGVAATAAVAHLEKAAVRELGATRRAVGLGGRLGGGAWHVRLDDAEERMDGVYDAVCVGRERVVGQLR